MSEHMPNRTAPDAASLRRQRVIDALNNFDLLPDSAFVRIDVVRALYGTIGRTTVWSWVKSGRLPPPEKLGPQFSAWNVGALRRARLASPSVSKRKA